MNSETRAFIVAIILFLLWGTPVIRPFSYIPMTLRDGSLDLLTRFSVPRSIGVILLIILFMAVACLLLFLGRIISPHIIIQCGAALNIVLILIPMIQNRSISITIVPIAICLGVVAFVSFFGIDEAALWLSDAFVFAIPVWLFYDIVLAPFFTLANIRRTQLSPFIVPAEKSLMTEIGAWFGLPQVVWGLFFFVLLVLPVMYFSRGREKSFRSNNAFY
ncbi:MAG TPA: hypothetical protein PKV44_03505 [Bacillota bacterium]|nr:hypothetical protein [Bacillota bacterium]HPE39031.1 hypothetical protein [Bacillota bacterium]